MEINMEYGDKVNTNNFKKTKKKTPKERPSPYKICHCCGHQCKKKQALCPHCKIVLDDSFYSGTHNPLVAQWYIWLPFIAFILPMILGVLLLISTVNT